MRGFLLIALALLAGCQAPHPPSHTYTLICTQDGRETFRSTKDWWSFYNGVWQEGYSGPQYKPSLMESCHTEVK